MSDNNNNNNSDDDNDNNSDWSNWSEDNLFTTVCPLCPATSERPSLMLRDHLPSIHNLNLLNLRSKHSWDYHCCVRAVNYLRAGHDPSALATTISSVPRDSPQYLTPVLENDALLSCDDFLDDDDDDSVQSFRDTVAPGSKHQDHHHHHSEAYDAHLKSRSGGWLSRLWNKHFDQANYYNETFRARDFESDYLALVPLSDPRLSHRWPLWVFVLLSALLCGTMFCAVFFFVQRQVEVNQGEIFTRTSSIHVNPIKPGDYHGNYSLDLKIDIPVHNQNYFPATISGGIGIYLYNYKGGEVELDHAQVPSRSTRVFSITANASNFDSMVTSTIIGRCTVLQPHLLQFVLKGEFSTEVLFYGAQTTRINTYAIVDCKIKEEWPWG